MDQEKSTASSIYTPALIEFATVGVEFAALMEQGAERRTYICSCLRVLPRLYSLVLALPEYFYSPEEDYIEEYITEHSYDRVRERAAHILGEDDAYLTTASLQMQYSDTPVSSLVSEQLADIYQHVGNLLGILRERNEIALPAAVGRCRLYWQEHWGLALVSALGALHQIYITLPEIDDMDDEATDLDELYTDQQDIDTDEL